MYKHFGRETDQGYKLWSQTACVQTLDQPLEILAPKFHIYKYK